MCNRNPGVGSLPGDPPRLTLSMPAPGLLLHMRAGSHCVSIATPQPSIMDFLQLGGHFMLAIL